MDLYAEHLLDHYRNPRNKHPMGNATVTHSELNPACGDNLKVHLHIENDVIQELSWEGEGCAVSQAAMSMLSEELIGKTIEEIEKLSPDNVKTMLGVPISERRIKCALLCIHTLKNAMHALRKEEQQEWTQTLQ